MFLAMETNTSIEFFEKCTFIELNEYLDTYNRIIEKRKQND